jgi:NAD-dependent SIR2 family protein deacetylase
MQTITAPDSITWIKDAKGIIVVAGAGISTRAGVPLSTGQVILS